MSWEKVKLSECCISISDGDHQPPPKASAGIPFVTISNINSENQFDFESVMYVPIEYYEKLDSKRKAQKNDILYSVVGSFGIPVFIKNDTPIVFQRHIAILRPDTKVIEPRFLYYTMLSRDFYMKADAVALGAAQRTISLMALRNMEINMPSLGVQRRIVEILKPYDDLIENNRKQIKLLEEMAQRLYKEWFVDLHFPGYEEVEIVDGVPEGWRITQLDTLGEFSRGKTITKADVVDGDIAVVAGGREPAYYHNVSNTEAPVITISASGANAGFVRMYYKRVWASDCSYVDKNRTNYIYYLYCFLKDNKVRIDNLQKGAAQPHVYAKDINALEMLVPSSDLLTSFESVVEPIFVKIRSCNEIIERNIQMRDKLLSYLMTGKLEV